MKSTAKIPGDLVHTERAGGARACSAASSCSCCSCCVTGLLICRLQRRAERVPASSTRRSDGSSVLTPVFFRLSLVRPQEYGGADNTRKKKEVMWKGSVSNGRFSDRWACKCAHIVKMNLGTGMSGRRDMDLGRSQERRNRLLVEEWAKR